LMSTFVPQLRGHLADRLPEYMVPSAMMLLDQLPLSPNGKVDRKALPAPERARRGVATKHEPPEGAAERAVAGIWTELLRVPGIGRHDSFFDLGGHSLLATQVVSRVRSTFQVEVSLRAFFESPTIAGLAGQITAAHARGASAAPPIIRVPREGPLPLSFAQQRLWFMDQLQAGSSL